jgi:hypothetical protein
MSVPLDRLYNFIHDLCDHDIIIYRFYPHGSKNMSNCSPLLPRFQKFDGMYMVCHDQEPLTLELYNISLPRKIHTLIRQQFFLYDKVLLLHSEQNSYPLTVFEQDDAIGVYWWSHAVIARDWFRYAEVDPALPCTSSPKYDFLIYNRAWLGTREYRLKFAELVATSGLYQNCYMNFSDTDNNQSCYNYSFSNPNFKIHHTDLAQYFRKNTATANYSADYDSNDYAQCGVEVVLETLFDDSRWHLTEKSLRPIACGKPFILAATPGSLKYLQSYGFKTFDAWIDESYDNIQDPYERLVAITKTMQKFSSMAPEHKKQMLVEMQEVCNYNRDRFFSDEFMQLILNELTTNLDAGVDKMQLHIGDRFKKTIRAVGSVANCKSIISRQELVETWTRLRKTR